MKPVHINEDAGSPLIIVLGSGLIWAWVFLLAQSDFALPMDDRIPLRLMQCAAILAPPVIFLLLGYVLKASKWLANPGVGLIASFVLCALCFIAQSLSLALFPVWALYLARALMSVLGSMICVVWGIRIILDTKRKRVLIIVSFICSQLIMLILFSIPHGIAVSVCALMPPLSMVLWLIDSHMVQTNSSVFKSPAADRLSDLFPEDPSFEDFDYRHFPWKSLTLFIFATVISECLSTPAAIHVGDPSQGIVYLNNLINIILSGLFLYLLIRDKKLPSLRRMYIFFAPIFMAFLLCMFFQKTMGLVLPITGFTFYLQMLTWLLVSEVAHHDGVSPLLAFAVSLTIVALSMLIGIAAGYVCARLFPDITQGVKIVSAFGIVITTAIISLRRPAYKTNASLIEIDLETDFESFNSLFDAALRQKVHEFSLKNGLSERESEVLCLIIKGASSQGIADELFVSYNTVRTHTQHIYQKLNVNSRQQAIDLFNDWRMSGKK